MKQSMKLAARILENLPTMSPDVMQGWIDNPKALRKFLAPLVPSDESSIAKSEASGDTTHLRFLQSAILAPTIGSSILAQASDVFTGYIDSDFKSWGTDVAGVDTHETAVDIFEMKQKGNFRDLFGSFGGEVCSLCLTQGQITEFARSHRHLLRQDGYATFFLFEVNGEMFVALVDASDGELKVYVRRFWRGHVWSAGCRNRVVVPQRTIWPQC